MATEVDAASHQPSSAGEYAAGQVLDRRYRLGSRLGRGGFGDVWRAEELLPDGAPFREVALKLLVATVGDAANWAEEAKLLASFRHPSLVTIYAAGILETKPPVRFVAMELLEGQNLSDVIRARGRVPWRRVLRWAWSTAAALDVIHKAGVVHLDLKPANLFLGADGALKVLDFGIARRAGSARPRGPSRDRVAPIAPVSDREAELGTAMFLAEKDSLASTQGMLAATQPMVAGSPDTEAATLVRVDRERGTATFAAPRSSDRVVIGTPGFMAPEVLELAEPTAAADAYALAVCVVQLVTGHLPHAAPDEPKTWDDPTSVSAWLDDLRRATLRGDLRDLDAGPAPIPAGLTALIRRLLSVDPLQRGVTAGKLGEMFEEVWQRPYGVPDPPYLGLSPYPPEAEGMLFGRDDDIARLGRELEFEPSVVLQGAPGAGKSSLANAGLVPYLALRGVDGKDDWIAARVAPGSDPDAALDRALARVSPDLEGASPARIASYCEAAPRGMALLVDPLEEVLDAPPEKSARLSALMISIAEGQISPGLRLIAALSEDHTAALASSPLGDSLRAALRFVGPPSIAAAADLVGGPAHFAGVSAAGTDAVVAEVQRELRAGAARLPFVALALRAFWDASASSRSLGAARWKDLGGVRGVIARHADRVIERLTADERIIADEILLRLSATDGSAARWAEADLLATLRSDADRAVAARALDVLGREHLVRRQGGVVEIAHEALLKGWPHLTSARLHQLDRITFLERVRDAAQAWERSDNDRELLLHGALLDEARSRRAWAMHGLLPAEREFVRASMRRARWRRGTRVAVGLTAALIVVGGVFAKHSVDAARDAETLAWKAKVENDRTAELAAKSRRTDDPYRRAAFIAAAMERGSTDAMLPLDLAGAASGVARADFLTLDRVTGATFPWDDRWAVGLSAGAELTLVDFHPPEPEVIEGVDIDVDPDVAKTTYFRQPKVIHIRPHADPIVERIAFAFDTSIVTRSEAGEVKVIRLQTDGTPVIAAVAPFRCAGVIQLAEAAPVLGCATDEGIVRWDLRKARPDPAAKEAIARHRFAGNVIAISADGARLAASSGVEVLLWSPEDGREATFNAGEPVVLGRWSPRDDALAVVGQQSLQVVDFGAVHAGEGPKAIKDPLVREALLAPPSAARWDDGGKDFGICEANGSSRWIYLRRGGRAKDDAPPTGAPCPPPRPKGQPDPLSSPDDYDELVGKDLGPYSPIGGWKLVGHHFLTRDLVLFNASDRAAARLIHFQGRDDAGADDPHAPGDSVVAVERGEGNVAVQIGGEVRIFATPDGKRLYSRPGHLLRRCTDGRFLAWTSKDLAFDLIDVASGAVLGTIPREPALVIGADSGCTVLYTQRLDGTLVATPIVLGAAPARAIGVADGYVFDARPSPARGAFAAGIWIALSSGAIARIDEPTSTVRVVGYASPRAYAVADGPRPGGVAYVDATGVLVESASGKVERVLDPSADIAWDDLSVSPDGTSMILVSADRIAALDLARHEIIGSIPIEGKGRLARWDDEGSVMAWSFDRVGGAEGLVIPRGVPLARQIASAASNLVVDKGKLGLRR